MLAHRAVPGAAANAAGDGGLSRMLRCNNSTPETRIRLCLVHTEVMQANYHPLKRVACWE
jgi:hypothetical protein